MGRTAEIQTSSTSTAETQPTATDVEKIRRLTSKLQAFAGSAEALAVRNVSRVRTLAALDLAAALWLGYYARTVHDWAWPAIVPLVFTASIPAMLLWKINGTLRSVIGLPARLTQQIGRIFGDLRDAQLQVQGAGEALAGGDRSVNGLARLAQLRRSAGLIREMRGLGDSARQLLTEAGGALLLTNPVFAILLAVSSVAAAAVVVVALGIALIALV